MRAVVPIAGLLCAHAIAHADDGAGSGAGSAGAGSAAAPAGPSYTLAGYVEAYYQHNFNTPSNLTTAYRGFDDRTDSLTVENAVLDVTGTLGAVSVRIALQVGATAASAYTSEPSYAAQAGTGDSDPELWRLIQQALVAYKVPEAHGLVVDGGIFLSPIGIENLPIKDQWNWSRSDLFLALPYYHAGVRATYPISDQLTAVAMVTNGWNDIVNRNPYPCVAGSLAYTNQALSVTGLYFGGIEPPTGSPEGQPWRNLFDATATWTPSARLAFAAQADTGFEDNHFGTAWWLAGAGYARAQVLPRLFAVARFDHFHEHEPPGGPRLFFPADDVSSLTLTLDARPEPDLSVRLEYRHDTASAPMYFRGTVEEDATGTDVPTTGRQDTITLGAVGWF